MIKIRNVAALLAISSVATLAACSSGGSQNDSQMSHASYASPQPPALSQGMIQQVQARLQQQGMYSGSIDGLWGPATEAGVRGYQQQHNINATGQLDGATLAALNLGGGQTSANVPPNAQRYGSNNNPPANINSTPTTSPPADNATQPTSTTP